MRRLVAVAMSWESILPKTYELSQQFSCDAHLIRLDIGLTNADEVFLDQGFNAVIIEMSDEAIEIDLLILMRELRSRTKRLRLIFMGPQEKTARFLSRFPFVGRNTECDFIDPTDKRRHPDKMNRILSTVFPKPQEKRQRLAS